MKWVVGAILVVGVAAAVGTVARNRRNREVARSTWNRAADAATSAAYTAANGVKGVVTHH